MISDDLTDGHWIRSNELLLIMCNNMIDNNCCLIQCSIRYNCYIVCSFSNLSLMMTISISKSGHLIETKQFTSNLVSLWWYSVHSLLKSYELSLWYMSKQAWKLTVWVLFECLILNLTLLQLHAVHLNLIILYSITVCIFIYISRPWFCVVCVIFVCFQFSYWLLTCVTQQFSNLYRTSD